MNDLRFATRQLLKSPGFTTVAVISLALGIGANTAIFSLVNAILLRSLPVPNPQELRVVQWSGLDPKTGSFSGSMRSMGARPAGRPASSADASMGPRTIANAFTYPQYRALRQEIAPLAELFGYGELFGVTVRGRGEPFTAQGLRVTGNFFSGLGVRPALGRLFVAEEEQAGTAPVVAISYGWWEREFGLDPGVLGQTISLNGRGHAVVGVLPRGFHGVGLSTEQEFIVPLPAETSPDHWWVQLMARLKPGVKDAQLQAALETVFAGQAAFAMKDPRIELSAGRAGPSYDRERYQKPLLILLGVVVMVLLVACANLAGLSLARGAGRQHELAVRAALGAGRLRLIRQSLTESLLLAFLGGGLGILLAHWGRTVASRLLAGSPEGLRYDLPLDQAVLGFTLLIALVTAVLSGLLPALQAGRADPMAGLKDRAALGTPRLGAGRVLAAAQFACSVLLITGAGLYVRTLVNLVQIDPGFAMEKLLLFKLNPDNAGYDGARAMAFYDRAQQSLAAIPGVRSATLTQNALLSGGMTGGSFFSLHGQAQPEGVPGPSAFRLTVSETFFSTLGIPILRGRELAPADTADASKVVVVNQTLARKYFPGEDAIGQILRSGQWNGTGGDYQIVGVCRDAKYSDIKTEVPPTVYFSHRQDPIGSAWFALRTAMRPEALVTAARKAVAAIDPNIPLAGITTQELMRDQRISRERLLATLCGALGLLALLLSCIGLYGLMAYHVARRTGEIGIRMALGATRLRVAAPILREALVLAGAGVAVGVPVALALSRLTESQLYGVKPNDPLSFVAAAFALVAIAAVAAWVPARRAAKVEPMTALRAE